MVEDEREAQAASQHSPERDAPEGEREAQRAALFGPAGRGEYHEKATVRFRDAVSGKELAGQITHIRAPAPAWKGGPVLPTSYIIDAGDGNPYIAYQNDIIEEIAE